ncbi:MAG TPA: TonB-dependent receptor [Bryobacteraceae bacterium]|nr:TonB-dependent receptor [Bryobacteraceae bacterium]
MNARPLHAVLFLTIGCETALLGQSPVPLRGVVLDPQGRPVAAARLSLFASANSNRIGQAQTVNGEFEFPGIPAGRYLIQAVAEGFRQTTVPVDFQPGAGRTVDVQLQVEGVRQSVVVTAEAGAQSMDQIAKAVSVISRAEIDARDEYSVSETVRNTPGLVVRNLGGPGQSTSIRSRGLGPSATAVLIDGMRFRDVATTQADASSFLGNLNIINPESVEVLRGSGSSLYGTNAVGGVVNVVTDQGGAPLHADLQVEGGNLGLLRGRGSVGSAALDNRLLYSGGLLHLNVMSGVDGHDRARSTGAQGFARYILGAGVSAGVRYFGSDDFVEPNSSPTAAGLPAANIPNATIVAAVPLARSQVENSLAGRPIQPGDATFIPSRDDPDNRRASRWYSGLFKLQQTVNALLDWQVNYQRVNTNRVFQNGPAGIGTQPVVPNRSQFTGGVDTVDSRATFRIQPWETISGGFEFERESYFNADDNRLPGPNRVSTETRALQNSKAFYLQNQLALLKQRLQISFSGRSQSFDLERPRFLTTGTANNYAAIPLASPPRALTGDAALSYFAAKTGTKLRAHAGNSYRAPALSERFGSGFFFNSTTARVIFSPFGDPRLAPDRYNSFDMGVDQYFAQNKIRVSGTYFYTRIVQTILFDSASAVVRPQTDPFLRTSGYFNAAGGISRGVELSAEAKPYRPLSLNASYTYTNANTDQDVQVRGFFRTFAMPAHTFTLVANQRIGKRNEVTLDLYQASSYFNPLSAAGRTRAYLYPSLTKIDAVFSRVIWAKDTQALRAYFKIDNLLDREYYETGFRTPGILWISGLRMNFR